MTTDDAQDFVAASPGWEVALAHVLTDERTVARWWLAPILQWIERTWDETLYMLVADKVRPWGCSE